MPSITLEVAKLSKEQKQILAKEFTDTASRVTGLPPEAFYIFIKENDLENISVGGRLLSDKMKVEK